MKCMKCTDPDRPIAPGKAEPITAPHSGYESTSWGWQNTVAASDWSLKPDKSAAHGKRVTKGKEEKEEAVGDHNRSLANQTSLGPVMPANGKGNAAQRTASNCCDQGKTGDQGVCCFPGHI